VLTAGRLSAAQPRSHLSVEAVGLLMAGAAPTQDRDRPAGVVHA
jgi:hypothetical protein